MVVVVIEAVVAAIVLTVNWRQISRRRIDAITFCDAEDIACGVAVGPVIFELVRIEGWIGCCALFECVSQDVGVEVRGCRDLRTLVCR